MTYRNTTLGDETVTHNTQLYRPEVTDNSLLMTKIFFGLRTIGTVLSSYRILRGDFRFLLN